MFETGDMILYGSQGVCRIEKIEKMRIDREVKPYYVLRPVYERGCTVFIPVDNEKLTSKMKHVLSVEQVNEIISLSPSQQSVWIDDDMVRKETFRATLDRGDRQEIACMIKALYLRQKKQNAMGKKLHMSDERLFKEAEKMLYDEFSIVLGIKRDQMSQLMLKKLSGGEGTEAV